MRLITDSILCTHQNTLENDPNEVGVSIRVDTLAALKNVVERDYNIPIASQHFWVYTTKPLTKTTRPSQYIRANEYHLTDTTILFLKERRGTSPTRIALANLYSRKCSYRRDTGTYEEI